jgi:hypothetical protein
LIPARVGLIAVAVPRRRNIQTGTAILNRFIEVYFMIKKNLFVMISLSFAFNVACSNTAAPNAEANKAIAVNASPANMPEGLSANQVPLSANSTPGIPDPKSDNTNAKGANSIPGIPDQTKTGKTPSTGKTPPIEGIPDEETLKKQMNTPADRSVMDQKPPTVNSNSANRPNNKRKPAGNP